MFVSKNCIVFVNTKFHTLFSWLFFCCYSASLLDWLRLSPYHIHQLIPNHQMSTSTDECSATINQVAQAILAQVNRLIQQPPTVSSASTSFSTCASSAANHPQDKFGASCTSPLNQSSVSKTSLPSSVVSYIMIYSMVIQQGRYRSSPPPGAILTKIGAISMFLNLGGS